jgi:hypothetical protein
VAQLLRLADSTKLASGADNPTLRKQRVWKFYAGDPRFVMCGTYTVRSNETDDCYYK